MKSSPACESSLMPMLTLSGLQDEVVPCEHMKGLWELVTKREAGTPAGTPRRRWSSASKGNGEGLTAKEGANPGTTTHLDTTQTLSKFVEFADGTHSKLLAYRPPNITSLTRYLNRRYMCATWVLGCRRRIYRCSREGRSSGGYRRQRITWSRTFDGFFVSFLFPLLLYTIPLRTGCRARA